MPHAAQAGLLNRSSLILKVIVHFVYDPLRSLLKLLVSRMGVGANWESYIPKERFARAIFDQASVKAVMWSRSK